VSGILLFFVGVLTLAGIYAILSMILNLEAGWAGMWDLGIAGFLAIGGYVFIITTQTNVVGEVVFAPQLPMWAGVVLGGLASGLAALLVGIPALRVRGVQFLIATLALAEVIKHLAINLNWVTRGTVGFNQFSRPFESMVKGSAYRVLLLGLVWVVVAGVYFGMRRLAHSPYGRVLRGLRDNDPVALSLGKHTNRLRLITFGFTGLLYGTVAPLYLWYVRSLNPKIFAADITFTAWTALVIGGIASKSGPLLGAVILLIVTEASGLYQGSGELASMISSSRWILLGLVLILVMRLRPEGILGEKASFAGASARAPKGGDA
jgi:branched-chain amino acid transport system permease protein